MKRVRGSQLAIHAVLLFLAALTFVPFAFVVNSSFRSNEEIFDSFFGVPAALKAMVAGEPVMPAPDGTPTGDAPAAEEAGPAQAATPGQVLTRGYRMAWSVMRRYVLNSILVSGVSAVGVVLVASITAYILARYRFRGSRAIFAIILSTMMIPAVLTLVPTYLLVRNLGLLDTYWALILPYVATGQVFAIFLFRSFFAALPEDLFESARIDGAGHLSIYLNIVLPLSRPILSVAAVMTILGTWNNFLWPFVTLSDDRLHVVASGLYVMSATQISANQSTMYAAYVISSIPLLVLFVFATRPFISGVTSGAIKA